MTKLIIDCRIATKFELENIF